MKTHHTLERANPLARIYSRDFVVRAVRGPGSGGAWSKFFARSPDPLNKGSISAGDFARYPRDSLYRGLNNIMTRKDINLIAEAYEKNKVDAEQLKIGIEVEKEHTDDEKVAEKIARDHLAEDPHYYTKLKKAGL